MSAPAANAPSGVVTFLFTDVEGSTRRWEADADATRIALAAHNEALCKAIDALEPLPGRDHSEKRAWHPLDGPDYRARHAPDR